MDDKVQPIREAFETWARERGHDTHRSSGDGYLTYSTQAMWVAYQAGREAIAAPQQRCPYCDDTGDVHSIDGEWRGQCSCPAGQAIAAPGVADWRDMAFARLGYARDQMSPENVVAVQDFLFAAYLSPTAEQPVTIKGGPAE